MMVQEMLFKDREVVADLHLRGGLDSPELFQKVELCYFLPTPTLASKVVLKFGISNGRRFVEKPVSLRFNHFGEVLSLSRALLEAGVRLGKCQGDVSPQSFGYLLSRELGVVEKIFRGVERE